MKALYRKLQLTSTGLRVELGKEKPLCPQIKKVAFWYKAFDRLAKSIGMFNEADGDDTV